MTSHDNIEIRSEEVQEILGTPPSWLVRWGSTVALVTVVILAWVSYFIKYPDTVTADIIVTSTEPPRKLVAEKTAYISQILVANEDSVEAGQTLMVFKSRAKFSDVLVLEDNIIAMKALTDSALLAFKPPKDLLLGELQDAFYEFRESQEALQMGSSRRLENLSVSQMQQQIRKANSSIEYEKKRKENLEKNLDLTNQRYVREQNLLKSRLSSVERVRQLQEEVLTLERMLQGIESSIKNKEFEIQMLRQEISGVKQGSRQNKTSASTQLKESYIRLQNQIENWKKEHLVVAPISGIVLFPNPNIGENQFVDREADLLVIVPAQSSGIVGRIGLQLGGSGKVQPGQRVVVKFDSYPFQEFGAVIGQISWKGKIPTGNSIPIEVTFPNGLVTTTGRMIDPNQQMVGEAEIITEEKRFVEWIFEKFRKTIS